jgi:N-carbamoylputrescine amidase
VKQTFPGGAMVVGPSGEILARRVGDTGEPGMLVADLERETLLDAQAAPEYLYRFRRPELYGPLAKPEGPPEPGR